MTTAKESKVNKMNEAVAVALDAYLIFLQETVAADYAKNFPSLTPPRIDMEVGKKYAKVWRVETFAAGRSIQAFVDLQTGDIFNPASYKAPAKHARGNVCSGQYGVDSRGNVNYMR